MLLSYTQIDGNLRRTAQKGYISLLDHYQLEALALKYFGVKDEDGEIIGYTCPYSGNLITDFSDIVLEHIIPVTSKGGTVLFNCIPTSTEVNKTSEKGTKPLIDWWTNSKYWDEEAPLRLEKLVNYMLEAYENVFKEYTIEEVENSYLDIELYDEEREITADLEYSSKKEQQIQQSNNKVQTYLGTILNFIETLEKHNINTIEIKNKLKQLEDNHIFEDIERYQLFQNIIQQLIISKIGDDNRSYLTYTLNIDKKKLMDSINSNNPQQIFNEINNRLTYIENLLKQNNLSIIDYFKTVGEITDIDVIYNFIDKITKKEQDIFLENIKLGIDSKIEIFIEMLNKGNKKILKNKNKETLEGYPNIKLAYFWSDHKERVTKKIYENLKNNPKYDNARKYIDEFEIANNVEKQIPIFIDMLNKGNSEILKQRNKETLEGYPNIKLANFWTNNKKRIIKKLFVDLKDNLEYNTARSLIDIKNIKDNIELRIQIFIDMLNKGNNRILKNGNKDTLEGYPNIKLANFWNNNKEVIIHKLFVELKDNLEYDIARKLIDINEMTNNVEKQIPIFINMLNKGNVGILKVGNKETLEGYPDIKLTYFWSDNKERIIEKLFLSLKDNSEYDTARRIVNEYNVENNIDSKINVFINMLNKGNSNILKNGNKETLEGYPNIKLSRFWSHHKEKIIEKLFEDLKDKPEYDNARRLVDINEMTNNVEKQIPLFINMLNKGNNKILKARNEETLEGYPNIKLSYFWNDHKQRIIQKLFEDLKDNQEYNVARQTVLTHLKVSTIEEYQEKLRKQQELKELKKMKKDLEVIEDTIELESNEHRKRA